MRHTFWKALMIPGVVEYSLSLFFIKLVCYAFTYWLPYYLGSQGYSPQVCSTTIHLSVCLCARACVCVPHARAFVCVGPRRWATPRRCVACCS